MFVNQIKIIIDKGPGKIYIIATVKAELTCPAASN